MSNETASKKYRQLHKRPNPVKNPGPPDRKAHAKLSIRIKDYADTVARLKNPEGYHKPGSMQR
jgi:hypothetical protein